MLISLEAKYIQNEEQNSDCFIKIAPSTHPVPGTSLWSELFQFSILDFITDLALGLFLLENYNRFFFLYIGPS